MTMLFMVVLCFFMAILSAIGIWEAKRSGVVSLWLLLGLCTYYLYGLTESYKAVVIQLGNR